MTSSAFGYSASKEILTKHPDITAIITDTDKMALGVYRAAAELGIAIPGQLSIAAFSDDSVFAPEFKPPLTGVKLFSEDLGREAAKLLIEQCSSEQRTVKRILIPTEMVERGSCAEAPGNNKSLGGIEE
jgi:DNA-binding LacI/PurR family transcriptional regulator